MDLKGFQKELKDRISNDDLNDTLDAIIKFSQNEDAYSKIENRAVLIKAKLDRIDDKKNIDDNFSPEDYSIGRAQVSEAILLLIDDLDSAQPITIPSSNNPPASTLEKTIQKDQIKDVIAYNDKIFIKIILGSLALSVILFTYFTIQSNWGGGGASFSLSAGTCYIYLNNKKQMLQSRPAAN